MVVAATSQPVNTPMKPTTSWGSVEAEQQKLGHPPTQSCCIQSPHFLAWPQHDPTKPQAVEPQQDGQSTIQPSQQYYSKAWQQANSSKGATVSSIELYWRCLLTHPCCTAPIPQLLARKPYGTSQSALSLNRLYQIGTPIISVTSITSSQPSLSGEGA